MWGESTERNGQVRGWGALGCRGGWQVWGRVGGFGVECLRVLGCGAVRTLLGLRVCVRVWGNGGCQGRGGWMGGR